MRWHGQTIAHIATLVATYLLIVLRTSIEKYNIAQRLLRDNIRHMDKKTLRQHRKIIERHGEKRLVEFTGMTRQAIEQWQKRGIPRAWLAALSGLPRDASK